MGDVEEDADFGSHFLDSLLEVEMTEEDNELDMSKNCDPLETLPPTPTFDLQSETLSYKNVYRRAVPQSVLATLPLATSTPSNIPLVLKPSSMLIYSGKASPLKPASVMTASQKISPKSNTKNPVKNVNISHPLLETLNEKFTNEVFRPEFVKNVFVKADPPWDISLVSDEEMKYYKTCFKDIKKVQHCKLHCTICDKHLGCAVSAEKKINVHTMLKVLTCKPCFEFYGDGNFPCDKGDNCEIYCRWCGQGGALVCCSFCPRVFCKRCVKRNYGPSFLKSIEKASDWACFCCAQKPLWPHRAICRALLEFIQRKKTDPKGSLKDTTSCCKATGLTRKKLRTREEKSKAAVLQSQLKVPPPSKSSESINKNFPNFKTKDLKAKKEQLPLKPLVQLKAGDKVRVPLNAGRNSKPSGASSVSSSSILVGNNVIRGVATTAPAKLFSAFTSPQLIQSPVIHGETLITPPSRFLLQAKSPTTPTSGSNSSYVRVSLTHQAPNLDMTKIPTVKIPHEVHGLVLRLIFPDNKMQYVRLASDGTGCKVSKEFPMPHFKEKGASFVEENLAEAFKISKMMFEKLMRIKEKVNSRMKFTEESVFNSSVKKLHLAYTKTIDLFKELDKTLLENFEEWQKESKNPVDVIDISDDETTVVKKNKPSRYYNIREKCKTLNDDSDIEILDDVKINGKSPANSNLKEKYRLRSSADQIKTNFSEGGPVRKRKKGRFRKISKRLKTVRMRNGQPEEEEGGEEEEEEEGGGEKEEEGEEEGEGEKEEEGEEEGEGQEEGEEEEEEEEEGEEEGEGEEEEEEEEVEKEKETANTELEVTNGQVDLGSDPTKNIQTAKGESHSEEKIISDESEIEVGKKMGSQEERGERKSSVEETGSVEELEEIK